MGTRYVLAEFARQDRKEVFRYTFERSGSVEVAWKVDEELEKTFRLK